MKRFINDINKQKLIDIFVALYNPSIDDDEELFQYNAKEIENNIPTISLLDNNTNKWYDDIKEKVMKKYSVMR